MSIKYNPNNDNIFDITNEKTDYRTDLKTDHSTDPNIVTKQEGYWYYYGPYDAFRKWKYRTVTDHDQIKRNKKLNEDNTKTNDENRALNEKNTKRDTYSWYCS